MTEVKVEGLDEVNRRLRDTLRKIDGKLSEHFLVKALMLTSAYTAPYVPVDTSNLINSEYRVTRKTRRGWEGEIGFSAEYAAPVHDGPDKNWQKAGASNQFLAKGLDDFIDEELDRLIDEEFGGDDR